MDPVSPTPTAPAPAAPSTSAPLDPISTLLGQTWQWFNAHFPKLLGISAVFLVAQIVIATLMVVSGAFAFLGSPWFDDFSLTALVYIILGLLVLAIVFGLASLWNTLALYTYIIRNDRALTVRQAIADSRLMILPYLGTSLMVSLYVILGLFLLIVPAIYWGVLFGFAPLITLVEGKNARALDRSKFLVKGNWWAVFLRQIVIGILVYVLSLVINVVFDSLFISLGSLYEPLTALKGIGGFFSNILFAPISLIFTYLLYLNLKRLKG